MIIKGETMKKLLLICYFLFASMTIPSLATANEHAVGGALGLTKGAGFTYRNIDFETGIGYQLTGLPVIRPNEGFVTLGVSALYVLNRGDHGIAYFSLGAGAVRSWNNCEDGEYCEEEDMSGCAFGPGLGFEFRFWKNFGISWELPLAIVYQNNKFEGIYPVPNSSLVYFW